MAQDLDFKSCRVCLADEMNCKLTSLFAKDGEMAEIFQNLSGCDILDDKAHHDALICLKCTNKVELAFSLVEKIRRKHLYFQRLRRQCDQAGSEQAAALPRDELNTTSPDATSSSKQIRSDQVAGLQLASTESSTSTLKLGSSSSASTVQQAECKKLTDELAQLRESSARTSQDLLELKLKVDQKEEDMKKLNDELIVKETQLVKITDKEMQIRKIAKRYKDQYTEIKAQVDSGVLIASGATGADVLMSGEPGTSSQQENIIRHHSQQQNTELKTTILKEASCKDLLLQAKTKMNEMTQKREQLTRELSSTKTSLDQRTEEHENVIRNLKSKYEARIQRLTRKINEHASDKSVLMQQFNHLQSQMSAGESTKPATSTIEKGSTDASSRIANVSLMVGPSQQSATLQQGAEAQQSLSQSQNVDNQAPSTSGTLTIPPVASTHHHASSSSTVTTTPAIIHKRLRDADGDSSTCYDQMQDKQLKRTCLVEGSFQQWRQARDASRQASDNRIVPSTPTLYRSRGDGFSEVVSSPHPAQVPHAVGRFTFSESSSSSSSSSRPMVKGMDETRIDLSQEHGQIGSGSGDNLINDSTSASTSSTLSSSISTVIQQDIQQEQPVAGSSNQEEGQVPDIMTGADDDYDGASTTSEASDKTLKLHDSEEDGVGVRSEGEKPPTSEANEVDTSKADLLKQPTNVTRCIAFRGSLKSPNLGRNVRGHRGGRRIQPLVWNESQQRQKMRDLYEN